MPLYKPTNPAALAQSAMSGATQAAASQTKQVTSTTRKDANFWDDVYKGARAFSAIGYGLHGMANAVEDVKSLYDAHKVKSAYDDVAKAYEQGGLEAIQNNPEMRDYWHNKATNQFMADRLNTEKGRLEVKQNIRKFTDALYQDFRVGALRLNEAYNKGDMKGFSSQMEQLTASQPTPYRLKALGDGTFAVQFRSDQAGDFVNTGERMSAKRALDLVNRYYRGETYVMSGVDMKLTPMNVEYDLASGRHVLATVEGNAQNGGNPSKDIILHDRRTGRIGGWAVVQNAVRDPATGLSGYNHKPVYSVFGLDGRELGVFEGLDGLARGTNLTHLNPGKPKDGGGANQKGASLIRDIATVGGEKSIDVEMAAALERGVAAGYTPFQVADMLKRNTDVFAAQIAKNNPHLTPEEVQQRARAKAFAGGGDDPLGLRGQEQAARPESGSAKAKERIKSAAARTPKPGTLDSLGDSDSELASYHDVVNGILNAGKGAWNWLSDTGESPDPQDYPLYYRP